MYIWLIDYIDDFIYKCLNFINFLVLLKYMLKIILNNIEYGV